VQSGPNLGYIFRSEFTRGLSFPTTEIVLDPSEDGKLFLFLPSLQNFFPPPMVDISRRHVADSLVIPLLVVKLDQLRDRPTQFLFMGKSRLGGAIAVIG
jgi:hypothetical protein